MTVLGYVYASVNVVVLIAYGVDKLKAMRDRYRISEKSLLLGGFLGPFGALFGMVLFRHKIRKVHFKVLVSLFVLIHIGLWFWLRYNNILL